MDHGGNRDDPEGYHWRFVLCAVFEGCGGERTLREEKLWRGCVNSFIVTLAKDPMTQGNATRIM